MNLKTRISNLLAVYYVRFAFILLAMVFALSFSQKTIGSDKNTNNKQKTYVNRGDQMNPDILKVQLSKFETDLNEIKVNYLKMIPENHELYDYFFESEQILARLVGYIKADLNQNNNINAANGLSEGKFLTEFLKEEIQLSLENAKINKRVYDVRSLGLKGDGITDNRIYLKNFLSNMADNKEHIVISFPEGVYRFKESPEEYAIFINQLHNISFEGSGKVVWEFEGYKEGSAILIKKSSNITFRNISVDIKPLTCTIGKIVGVEDGNTITIKISEDYPEPDSSYQGAMILRGLVRDPETFSIDERCGDPRIIKMEKLEKGLYKLKLDDNPLSGNKNLTTNFTSGHLFSVHPRGRPNGKNHLNIIASKHLYFKSFNLHAGDGMMAFINRSAGIKFVDCAIEPSKGRCIMNNADGINCPSNYKGIYLERCKVLKTNDDCLNFHANIKSVIDIINDQNFIVLGNELDEYFGIDDPIAFINTNTGEFDAYSTVKEIKKVQYKNLSNCWMITTANRMEGIISRVSAGRSPVIKNREYTSSGGDAYRSAMAIESPFEHMIINMRMKNDGFIIRNCEFGLNRATGFRCKATNGLIKDSRFYNQYIDFKVGFDWFEGTYPSNINLVNVTLDKGAFFYASLPGKTIAFDKLANYFRNINFLNVRDSSGRIINVPDYK